MNNITDISIFLFFGEDTNKKSKTRRKDRKSLMKKMMLEM
jgi:hypothetical protein